MNTNGIGQTNKNTAAYATAKANNAAAAKNKSEIGSPKLSDKAQKYYDNLKKKYSNMEFILVSEDQKEEAQANLSNYKSSKELLVLIDTEKIEKMAVDEDYRKKYEGIISGAASQLEQIKKSLGSMGESVKTYGMKFDDGGLTSFFAVIDKSMAAQRKLIKKRAAKKAEEQKKSEKDEKDEKIKGSKDKKTPKDSETSEIAKGPDTVTVTASSMEELLKKIKDTIYDETSDAVQTEKERLIGQNVNYTA